MLLIGFLLNLIGGLSWLYTPPGPTEGGIVVQDGILTIRGQVIDPKWKHGSFEKALGKHNRNHSIVDIYDSTGIMLWTIKEDENPEETEITEFKVILGFDSTYTEKWYCSQVYTGLVMIEGHAMNRETSWNELQAALPQYKFTNSGHTGWYDGSYKNIYIFAQFNNSLDHLVYLAIGLDTGDNYD
jgi:hypothetical protein